jgi:hypothetical protein
MKNSMSVSFYGPITVAEANGCRDATSFSTWWSPLPHETTFSNSNLSACLSTFLLYCLIAEQISSSASSHTLFATFFRNSQLPSASYHLLCSAAQSRRNATPALRSIQFP